ncbi:MULTISPECIES: DnaA/Hda family protein [Asaia]|uniref:DnaA/Hda family protein n=1 Tax=Asaia TaxID=91914 RepID=UPI00255583AA|nr:chromosomal replication initiator DnaA [Asaia sp. HumB]MDL2169991.1 chromosomal replication initiator DnaA [Asaia sp. HumB]
MDKEAGIDGLAPGNAAAQLALALRPPASVAARHFIPSASNAQARHWLNQTGWPDRRLLLCGDDSCGKSHLLHIWAARRQARVVDAATLDMAQVVEIAGAAHTTLALDHLERVTSERALLHLLNLAREHRTTLLIASRYAPVRLPIVLPDLASRLRAITVVPLLSPEDSLRFALLLRLIAERQMIVSKPILDWLMHHLPRTCDAIVSAVDRLDQAGLAHNRPLTRVLARQALSGLLDEPAPGER